MRPQVYEWVKATRDTVAIDASKVLEVGSYNVNGSVRDLFPDSDYIGIDIRSGSGVDLVLDVTEAPYKFGAQAFDLVLCVETLEHVRQPFHALLAIWDMLRPDGVLLLTMASFDFTGACPYHAEPQDFWRFSADAGPVLMERFDLLNQTTLPDYGLALAGRKAVAA